MKMISKEEYRKLMKGCFMPDRGIAHSNYANTPEYLRRLIAYYYDDIHKLSNKEKIQRTKRIKKYLFKTLELFDLSDQVKKQIWSCVTNALQFSYSYGYRSGRKKGIMEINIDLSAENMAMKIILEDIKKQVEELKKIAGELK